jgi:hypothetical protein
MERDYNKAIQKNNTSYKPKRQYYHYGTLEKVHPHEYLMGIDCEEDRYMDRTWEHELKQDVRKITKKKSKLFDFVFFIPQGRQILHLYSIFLVKMCLVQGIIPPLINLYFCMVASFLPYDGTTLYFYFPLFVTKLLMFLLQSLLISINFQHLFLDPGY